jgi:C4-dicarboxylate transporter, DctM subunit
LCGFRHCASTTATSLLNIVSSIAPDVPVTRVMWGTIPYVVCMMLAIVILCIFPEIATWLPDYLMGPLHR